MYKVCLVILLSVIDLTTTKTVPETIIDTTNLLEQITLDRHFIQQFAKDLKSIVKFMKDLKRFRNQYLIVWEKWPIIKHEVLTNKVL